ncbi:MAG: YIP1 family protein [Chthoniobacterales bacterium]
MIHVSRSGATLGIFEEEKVREGLRTGQFIGTDLGWMEGMPTWRPLSELENFRTAAQPPPPQAAAPPPTAAPAAQPVVPVIAPAAARTGLPWETRTGDNLLNALFDTIVMVLTKPDQAFAIMKREGGLGDPLFYAVICGTAGSLISLAYEFFMKSFGMGMGRHGLGALFGMGFLSILIIICIPVLVLIGVFIGSAITHLCLMIVGGAKQPFETTLRVLSYGNGSAHLLNIVPFCGGIIALMAALIVGSIGLARAHETDTWRAVVAILLPMVVCCGGAIFIFFAIFAGAMASGNWH